MRRSCSALAVSLVLVGAACNDEPAREVRWTAPPPKVVSDWPNESPFTYYWRSDIDDSGRFVAFTSSVRDGAAGIYLRDMDSKAITQLDIWTKGHRPRRGSQADERNFDKGAGGMAISGDGRYVVFSYGLDTLKASDRNRRRDIFRYDRTTQDLELVSISATGEQADGGSDGPAISRDGRYIAFTSQATNLGHHAHQRDAYVKDMETGEVTILSPGSGGYGKHHVYNASISDDGQRVVFVTTAEDLVPDDHNGAGDAFMTDLTTGETTLVSLTSDDKQIDPIEYTESASDFRDGVDEATISGDGRVIAFSSHANGIVPEDANNNVDVFVRDLNGSSIERVSVTSSGNDAYRPDDRECGINGQCFGFIASRHPMLSRDGRYVAFISGAPLLEPPGFDNPHGTSDDVFVHDRVKGLTVLVNRDYRGRPTKSSNVYPGVISPDASWITYSADGRVLAERHGRDENGDLYLQELPIPFEVDPGNGA